MRYPSFRWLATLLALALAIGSCAVPALRAQDRSAVAPPARPWWDTSKPAPTPTLPNGMQPIGATTTPPAETDGKIYRLQRDQHGEAKALILDADEIATWTEKVGSSNYCVFMFRGLVFVQQGIVQARFEQGVAWIDLSRYRLTNKLRTEIYAEGKVRIDDGSTVRDYPRAILDLTTRGEFRVNTHRNPLVRQSFGDDPLVQRGRAEGLGPRFLKASTPAPSPLQRTSFVPEHQLVLPPTVRPELKSAPAASPNLQPTPPLPSMPLGTGTPQGAAPSPVPRTRTANYAPPVEAANAVAPAQIGSPTTTIPAPGQSRPVPATPVVTPPEPQPPQADVANGSQPAPDGSVPPSGPTRVPPNTPPVPPPSKPTPPPIKGTQLTPNFYVAPRQGGKGFPGKRFVGANGEAVFIITDGVILQVRNANKIGMIDMEADQIVLWTHGDSTAMESTIQQPGGHSSNDLEVYLYGHVVIRQAPTVNPKGITHTITASEVYYDVSRSVAIAKNGRMELKQPLLNDPIVAIAKEIRQTSANVFEVVDSEVFSSRLPSDPGLKVYLQEGVIENQTLPLRNILGTPVLDRTSGQPVMLNQSTLTGENTYFTLEKIPFFYLPHICNNLQEPLGPVQDFNFGFNQLFGAQFGASLNLYEVLGLQPQPQSRWLANVDYMSYRGPGLGTLYSTASSEVFGVPGKYSNTLRAYGMYDRGYDVLGGPRPVNDFRPPNFRGWLLDRIVDDEMPYGFSVLSQISAVSDRNFIEQYYQRAWDLDPDFSTFLMAKQQQDNWEWSAILEPRLSPWVTQTQNLPRLDGYVVGHDFFNFITYTSHVNAEYASLLTSNDPLPAISVTDQNDATARLDWMQEAEIPFSLGPLKLAPYARVEETYYSQDLQGNSVGRSWEAGGVRASMPLTHLYSDVSSEYFNLNGLNHKVNLNVNYIDAYTNVPYTALPQLDQLNTQAASQALRDIKPYQFEFNPNAVFGNHGYSLIFSPYYNTPQTMAIRRLVLDRAIDTLSTIEEVQLQASQRLQTKRGFPGNQHIVDWMMLDLSATYFPAYRRDNFGNPWSFLQYNYLWNVGDRTALTSVGWTDPFPGGVRLWTVGGYFNRPDRTNYYLGFRYIDPLMVRAVTASMSYIFSAKYAATVSSTYDFGTGEAFANSLMFTRMGSDLQVSLGISYNALQSNFNLLFNIVPNLLPANKAFGPMGQGSAGGGVLNSNF